MSYKIPVSDCGWLRHTGRLVSAGADASFRVWRSWDGACERAARKPASKPASEPASNPPRTRLEPAPKPRNQPQPWLKPASGFRLNLPQARLEPASTPPRARRNRGRYLTNKNPKPAG